MTCRLTSEPGSREHPNPQDTTDRGIGGKSSANLDASRWFPCRAAGASRLARCSRHGAGPDSGMALINRRRNPTNSVRYHSIGLRAPFKNPQGRRSVGRPMRIGGGRCEVAAPSNTTEASRCRAARTQTGVGIQTFWLLHQPRREFVLQARGMRAGSYILLLCNDLFALALPRRPLAHGGSTEAQRAFLCRKPHRCTPCWNNCRLTGIRPRG
jgi:hypothetical protein